MSDTTVSNTNPNSSANRFDDMKYAGEGRVSFGDGTSMSVMEAVSFLYLERSETFSQLSKDKMQQAQDNLKKIREARDMLQKARDAKAQASKKKSTSAGADFDKYCTDNNISQKDSNDDDKHHSDQWDAVIEGLQSHLDSLTDSNQLEFLKLKSTVNKLDESITAANKAVDKNHDAIKGILSR